MSRLPAIVPCHDIGGPKKGSVQALTGLAEGLGGNGTAGRTQASDRRLFTVRDHCAAWAAAAERNVTLDGHFSDPLCTELHATPCLFGSRRSMYFDHPNTSKA